MKYIKTNNTYIVEVPVKDFKVIMNDSAKKSALPKNYCNAGFFANFMNSKKQSFTLPVAHLVCDYDAKSTDTKKYCTERGKFNGNKFTFDSSAWSYNNDFYKKAISTLIVKNNKAEIKEIVSIPSNCSYAISGAPIMKNGLPINFENGVKSQGWDSSPFYATWHIFIGLKKDSDAIYIIGMETKTWNMIKTGEAYKKFKSLGMNDVIKLDGGGSFHMNVDGETVVGTWENRRINNIICFDGEDESTPNNNNSVNTTSNNKENKNTVTKVNKLKKIITQTPLFKNMNNLNIHVRY